MNRDIYMYGGGLGCEVCLTRDSKDCSLLGSSVLGILQASIVEWVAISFNRGSSWPSNRIQVSYIAGRFFAYWVRREALFICICVCIYTYNGLSKIAYCSKVLKYSGLQDLIISKKMSEKKLPFSNKYQNIIVLFWALTDTIFHIKNKIRTKCYISQV